jgi:hypothetical protein
VLDVAEQHMAEAFGLAQCDLFDDNIGLGKSDTAELGRRIDGQDHLLS